VKVKGMSAPIQCGSRVVTSKESASTWNASDCGTALGERRIGDRACCWQPAIMIS
jgi:hypothetical protein